MRRLLFPLLTLVLLFCGCNSPKSIIPNDVVISDINIMDIDSMTIKALPSPPKMKNIEGKDEIEKVINHINSIDKEKIKQEDIKGWEFFIQTKGNKEHSIYFVGNIITIDDAMYKVNSDEVSKFRDLYDSLNYKEESVH